MLFNDEEKDWIYLLGGKQKAPFPSLTRNLIKVPGKHGAYLQSTDVEPIIINQPIGFVVKNDADALAKKDELASWLFTTEPKPLVFPDEPNRTYYAVVQNTIEDFDKFVDQRSGTIQFLCLDPYGYEEEETYSLSNVSKIPNAGTADAYPVFDLTITKESELIYLGNLSSVKEDGSHRGIYIGTEVNVDEEVIEARRLVFHDTMQSTASWTGASDVDSGYVSGQMQADSEGFYANPYGDENDEDTQHVWVGPSLQKSLADPLDNFEARFLISNHNYRDGIGDLIGDTGVGIVEFYFRDLTGNMICKIQFGDVYSNAAINHVVFATSERTYEFKSDNPVNWNDFDGELVVVRDGGILLPKIIRHKNGRVVGERAFGSYIPSIDSVTRNDLATIQVAVRKYHRSKRIAQRISEIKIFDIVGRKEQEKTVVHKFYPGDRVQIAVQAGLVLVNGEEMNDLIHLGTDLFTLVEGLNEIESSDNFNGAVTFRKRYL